MKRRGQRKNVSSTFKSVGKRLEAETGQRQWKLGTDESASGLQATDQTAHEAFEERRVA